MDEVSMLCFDVRYHRVYWPQLARKNVCYNYALRQNLLNAKTSHKARKTEEL